jgi:hypothetical protein
VIISPRNPVAKLSLQQLQGIFSGAISDWSQVGGAAGRINVYARDSKSGTFDTFKTLVLDPENLFVFSRARVLRVRTSSFVHGRTSSSPFSHPASMLLTNHSTPLSTKQKL